MATDMENQLIEVTYYPKLKQMLIATSLVIFWHTYAQEITLN